eukprot:363506-Chlamydomonas_euryale.AAC.14
MLASASGHGLSSLPWPQPALGLRHACTDIPIGLGARTCMHVLGLGQASALAGAKGHDLQPRRIFCARTIPPPFHVRVNARNPSCILHGPIVRACMRQLCARACADCAREYAPFVRACMCQLCVRAHRVPGGREGGAGNGYACVCAWAGDSVAR